MRLQLITPGPPVTVVLLLEILITVVVFGSFWISSTQVNLDFSYVPALATLILAPITGLGEQQIDSDRLVAEAEK